MRQRDASFCCLRGEFTRKLRSHVCRGERGLVLEVSDAEAAAEVELGETATDGLRGALVEVEQAIGCGEESARLENLRADVRMEAEQFEDVLLRNLDRHPLSVGDGDAKFLVFVRGRKVGVRGRVDTGIHANAHARACAHLACERREALELMP